MSRKRKYFKNDMFQVIKGRGIKHQQQINKPKTLKTKINPSHFIYMMYAYSQAGLEADEQGREWVNKHKKKSKENNVNPILSEIEGYETNSIYLYFNDYKEQKDNHGIDISTSMDVIGEMLDINNLNNRSVTEDMHIHQKEVDAIETIHQFCELVSGYITWTGDNGFFDEDSKDKKHFEQTTDYFQQSFKDFVYYKDKVYESDFYHFVKERMKIKDGSNSPFIVEIDFQQEDLEVWDFNMMNFANRSEKDKERKREITPDDLVNCSHYLDLT